MRSITAIVILTALGAVTPLLAAPSDINITSAILVVDRLAEIRGTVHLNGEVGALVTVTCGGVGYTTATDAQGKWSVIIAARANTMEATCRGLDGQAGTNASSVAAVPGKDDPVGPATGELYDLCKGMLEGSVAAGPASVSRLAQLMDGAVLHGGGTEYDQRMAALLLGCMGRIAVAMDSASPSERNAMSQSLSALGHTLYRAVVRGLDGQPPKTAN